MKKTTMENHELIGPAVVVESVEAIVHAESSSVIEKRMQILEIENGRLMKCQGQIIKETNRKLELYTNENRFLQYAFNKLKKQNEELRELCCFLDDDRKSTKKHLDELIEFEKSKSIASEQIIAENEENLKAFQEREKGLTEENRRMKSMCDSWIEFALKNSPCRDCGDGSSDSENLNPKSNDDQQPQMNLNIGLKEDLDSSSNENTVRDKVHASSSSYGDLIIYIKSLETRVNQLEHERSVSSTNLHINPKSHSNKEIASSSKDDDEEEEEDSSLETSSSVQEEQKENQEDIIDKNAEWADQFEEEPNFYINRLRNGYYSGRDDNDNLLVLSPIAEESESESCSSSEEDLLATKQKYPPKISLNLKCDQFDDNEQIKMISRKNIKCSTDWNDYNNIHRTITNLTNQQSDSHLSAKLSNFCQGQKVNSSTSIDVCGAQSLLDMFSNNLQSTTI